MLYTLVAWVEDRPGVLARVAGLFRRRGYNIASIIVGRSEKQGLSRMTVVVDPGSQEPRLVEDNLRKLVDVVDVHDVTNVPTVLRELALIKVQANAQTRVEISQLADIFRTKIIDVGRETLIIEVCATSEKIDRLLEVLEPHGILELMRTGRIAMTRGRDPILGDAFSESPSI